jgi:subtilisin family serine protease
MAPAAQLYLIKIATDADLDQAVSYAIAQGADVISTSLTFLNITPGDGTGRFAAMANRARAAGILWTTAAGNYRETHWAGISTDGDNDNLHEYAPGVEVNVFGPGNGSAFQIPAGVVLSPALRWDDWTEVRQDFRLLLLRYNGTTFDIVASANNAQTGLPGQRPTERLNYITTGGAAIYGVAIQRIAGARPVFLNLLTPNRELDRRVPAMSLGDLADVPGVLTVGAVTINAPFPAADYSSEGPTAGPGGAPNGGQRKPDIVAFAGVSTASYGTRAFSGTSAATPHVAGAAALVSNRYPTFGADEIRFHLEEMAVDQGPVCADTRYGFGRLLLRLPGQPAGTRLFLPLLTRGDLRC